MSWMSWMLGLDGRARSGLLGRPVGQLELAEARAIKVGDSSHAEPVPLFASVLRFLTQPPPLEEKEEGHEDEEHHQKRLVHCFAELKADGYSHTARYDPQLSKAAAAAVTSASIPPTQLTWISFSLGALVDMKRRMPEHKAYLVAYVSSVQSAKAVAELAVDSGLDGIDLNADPAVVTTELVDWLHARGKQVAVWVWKAPGSNDVESVWAHMERVGVDFFTSNLPREIEAWRKAREA